jgi:hypothetical protein
VFGCCTEPELGPVFLLVWRGLDQSLLGGGCSELRGRSIASSSYGMSVVLESVAYWVFLLLLLTDTLALRPILLLLGKLSALVAYRFV